MFNYLTWLVLKVIMLTLPLRLGYWLGHRVADVYALVHPGSRATIQENLRVVLAGASEQKVRECGWRTFRSFARYLIDFLRASRVHDAFIEKHVRLEGREHLDAALFLIFGKG